MPAHESLASGKKQLAVRAGQSAAAPTVRGAAGAGRPGRGPQGRGAEQGRTRPALVQAVKHLRLPITGTLGFKKAEVTAGGVALDEVDSRTMQSKLVPGSVPGRRSARPGRPHRRLQLPGRLEHRLARGQHGVNASYLNAVCAPEPVTRP